MVLLAIEQYMSISDYLFHVQRWIDLNYLGSETRRHYLYFYFYYHHEDDDDLLSTLLSLALLTKQKKRHTSSFADTCEPNAIEYVSV